MRALVERLPIMICPRWVETTVPTTTARAFAPIRRIGGESGWTCANFLGRLRLAAEMKLPRRAWLEFEVTENDGESTIRQTAHFDPAGLAGLYWYGIYPLHVLVFRGMHRGIAPRATR